MASNPYGIKNPYGPGGGYYGIRNPYEALGPPARNRPASAALSSYAQRHLENLAEEFLAKHIGPPMAWYLEQLGDA